MGGSVVALSFVAIILSGAADALVGESPCHGAIARQLESWGATDEILRAPAGPLGGDVFRVATERLGVWVTLHLSRGPKPAISLFLTDSSGTTRRDYDERCNVFETRTAAPEPTAEAFTDERLESRLAENSNLVVYVWSPHLPLSVDGYREIAAATTALGVPFVAVVDPSASADFVKRAAEEAGIPRNARRPVGSVELLFRDLVVHAPAILVFTAEGASAPLPGYRNAEAYRRHIEEILRN